MWPSVVLILTAWSSESDVCRRLKSISDVCRRQMLTSKVDPCAVRVNIFIVTVDP